MRRAAGEGKFRDPCPKRTKADLYFGSQVVSCVQHREALPRPMCTNAKSGEFTTAENCLRWPEVAGQKWQTSHSLECLVKKRPVFSTGTTTSGDVFLWWSFLESPQLFDRWKTANTVSQWHPVSLWWAPLKTSICLRACFIFPCWFYRESITAGNMFLCVFFFFQGA